MGIITVSHTCVLPWLMIILVFHAGPTPWRGTLTSCWGLCCSVQPSSSGNLWVHASQSYSLIANLIEKHVSSNAWIVLISKHNGILLSHCRYVLVYSLHVSCCREDKYVKTSRRSIWYTYLWWTSWLHIAGPSGGLQLSESRLPLPTRQTLWCDVWHGRQGHSVWSS